MSWINHEPLKVIIRESEAACDDWQGTGKRFPCRNEKCPRCNGTGRVMSATYIGIRKHDTPPADPGEDGGAV